MIARQNIDRDARRLDRPQFFRKRRVAQKLPVEGEIAGEDQGFRLLPNDLGQKSGAHFVDPAHELTVAALGEGREHGAVIGQIGGEIVEIRRNDHLVFLRLYARKAAQQQRKEQHRQDKLFHPSPPFFLSYMILRSFAIVTCRTLARRPHFC